jgi:hypothetical protein
MNRFKMFLCRVFNHKFEYYFLNTDHEKNIRVCKRCHIAQEYKWHMRMNIWSTIMWRTKLGAKKHFEGMSDCETL